MSLPYPFPFWVVAEQKRQRGQEVTVSLAILNLAELNLRPRPCSRYSLFLCWKGTLISQPTNISTAAECLSPTACDSIHTPEDTVFSAHETQKLNELKLTSRATAGGIDITIYMRNAPEIDIDTVQREEDFA